MNKIKGVIFGLAMSLSFSATAATTVNLEQLYQTLRNARVVMVISETVGPCEYHSQDLAMIGQVVDALQTARIRQIPETESFFKGHFSRVTFTLADGSNVRLIFDREYPGDEQVDAVLQLPGQAAFIPLTSSWTVHRDFYNWARKVLNPVVPLEVTELDAFDIDHGITEEHYRQRNLERQQEKIAMCNGVMRRPSRFRDHSIPQTCVRVPYHYIYDGRDPESCIGGWQPDPYLEGRQP